MMFSSPDCSRLISILVGLALVLCASTASASDLPRFPTPGEGGAEEEEEASDAEGSNEESEDETEDDGAPSDQAAPAAEPTSEPTEPEPTEPEPTAPQDESAAPSEPDESEAEESSEDEPRESIPADSDSEVEDLAIEERTRTRLLRRSVYDQGRWSIGIEGLFSRTTSRVELLNEPEPATDTTRFMRVDPSVTIGVIDRLHVGLVGGFISRRLAREGAESSTETSYAIQPAIQYYLPITPRLAGFGHGAAGYFRGGSERFIDEEDEFGRLIGEEDTRTRGFILTLGTGVAYRLSEGIQLQFGFSFNALWGRESVEALDQRLSTSTYHLGTNAGLRYTF